MTDSKYVVFQDSQGNEISNDPRWRAERILGLQNSDGVDPRDAELEELRAFKAAHEVAQAPNEFTAQEEAEEEDDAPDSENPYADVKGAELSALAKERGITIVKGMKAGDVRDALAAQDVAQ